MSALPTISVYNDGYIAELFERYRNDPGSVDVSWRQYFAFAERLTGAGPAVAAPGASDVAFLRKVAGAASMVSAIQNYGHLAVQIDPLGSPPPGADELTPEFHGITEQELSDVPASALGGSAGTAADVVAHMRSLYCGTIGFDFDHLEEAVERDWFRRTIESQRLTAPLSAEEKIALLRRLTQVDGLERFLGLAFVNVKRFSIEGLDAMVPMLDEAIARAAQGGARAAVIGMAHRGRLNVLTHVMGKPYERLLEEFLGRHHDTNSASGTGDVKYHMGYAGERRLSDGASVTLELVPNPSHLEAVNPVLMGVTRAWQRGADGTRDE
ncbi:MAG TPA: hypothetical protein VMM18_01940, partial [Gemmatimonadaceae bacterium]|nr:hypothetical protein [Gemmatimonadaceae bacterium]